MKYVILIHSNPQPWGHPTPDFLPEYQGLPEDVRERLTKDFEEVLSEMQAVRAHLRELAGDRETAAEDYRQAARLTASLPEQRYLNQRLAHLTAQMK